jgi:hypothetical protein
MIQTSKTSRCEVIGYVHEILLSLNIAFVTVSVAELKDHRVVAPVGILN